MAKIITLSFCFFLLSYSGAFSQYKYLEFSLLVHSLRVEHNEVELRLRNNHDGIFLHVKSTPAREGVKWEKTKVDTLYPISVEDLNKIGEMLDELSSKEIFEGMDVSTLYLSNDGYGTELKYGDGGQNHIMYDIWSPEYGTKNRKLEKYYEVCKAIVKLSRLKPKEILK